jgi:hypothetical protein
MLHMRVSTKAADMWRAIAQARGVSLNQACRDQLERGEQRLPPELLARVLSYDEPEGQVSARRALTAIGETIGQQCSICRSRHGSEVRHAAE